MGLLSNAERKVLAEEISTSFFLHLGIDVRDPVALGKLRNDLSFLSRLNSTTQEVKKAAIKTGVGTAIAGLVAIFILGFTDWFKTSLHIN